MSQRHLQYIVAFAIATLAFSSNAVAQSAEKASQKTVAATTSSDAALAALGEAATEIQNLGGAHRADPKLKALVDADPKFALGRGIYATWTSTFNAADRAKELNRALADAASASTNELLIVAAFREWRAGRAAVARDLLDVVLKQAPDDPNVHWFRMVIAANADESLALALATTRKFPDFAPPYNQLAYRLNATGKKEEAITAVQKYVSLLPKHPNPHDSYAEILSLQGQFDESDTHYKHAIAIDPSYEVGHEGLAENAVKRGNYAVARTHLGESLKLAGTPARRITLMNEIAVTYVFENKIKEAQQQYTAGIQVAEAASLPGRAQDNHRLIGMLDAISGRSADAMKHYAAGAPSNPGPFIPVADAILHGSLGHADAVAKAVAAMKQNAAAAPDDAARQDALHLTMLIHAVASKDPKAAAMHQAAIKLPVFRALGGGFLAKPLARAGDKAGAKAAMDDVMAFNALDGNAALARMLARR